MCGGPLRLSTNLDVGFIKAAGQLQSWFLPHEGAADQLKLLPRSRESLEEGRVGTTTFFPQNRGQKCSHSALEQEPRELDE